MNICKQCNTPNEELCWAMVKDEFVCLYCYNGNYNEKQVKRMRDKDKSPLLLKELNKKEN